MIKQKKSGPAIFMHCVISITLILSVVCFALHYGKIFQNRIILWTGIVSFMIMYHLWLRIIMGNVSKLFNISFTQKWFKEMPFEMKLYSFLKVKKRKPVSAKSNYGKGLVFKMISKEGEKFRFKYTGHTRYKPNKSSTCGYGSDEWFYLCNNKDGDYMLIFSDTAQGGPMWICYQLFPEESNKLKSSELLQWLEIGFDYYKKKNRKQIIGLHLENISEVKPILPRYSRMQTFEDEHYYGIY